MPGAAGCALHQLLDNVRSLWRLFIVQGQMLSNKISVSSQPINQHWLNELFAFSCLWTSFRCCRRALQIRRCPVGQRWVWVPFRGFGMRVRPPVSGDGATLGSGWARAPLLSQPCQQNLGNVAVLVLGYLGFFICFSLNMWSKSPTPGFCPPVPPPSPTASDKEMMTMARLNSSQRCALLGLAETPNRIL